MISRLNPKQLEIIKSLGIFKFLTYDQLIVLGIDKHIPNLSNLISQLIQINFVCKIPQRIGNKAKFYLTKKGADYLLETHEMQAHYPIAKITTDTQDTKHRTALIDLHIAFSRFDLVFFDRYFDKTGNAREGSLNSKTAIKTSKGIVKPDAIFMIQTSKQKELYVLELEMGKDKKKSYEKIIAHSTALKEKQLNRQLEFNSGYRVLLVFENENIMHSTLELVQDHALKEYFLSKSLEMDSDPFYGWINLVKEPRQLYYA